MLVYAQRASEDESENGQAGITAVACLVFVSVESMSVRCLPLAASSLPACVSPLLARCEHVCVGVVYELMWTGV